MPKSKKGKHHYGRFNKCPNQLCDFTFTSDRAIQLYLFHSKHCAITFQHKILETKLNNQIDGFNKFASAGGGKTSNSIQKNLQSQNVSKPSKTVAGLKTTGLDAEDLILDNTMDSVTSVQSDTDGYEQAANEEDDNNSEEDRIFRRILYLLSWFRIRSVSHG